MRAAHWVWLVSSKGEWTLAYYYENPDTHEWGYGFNIADGGGFIPEDDLSNETRVVPAIVGVRIEYAG